MIEKINMAYFIFEEHDISSVIVGTTEDITNRVLTLISKSKGIPSYCLQHGAIMGEEAFFQFLQQNRLYMESMNESGIFKEGELILKSRYWDIQDMMISMIRNI